MAWLILIVVLGALVLGPGVWVQRILKKYSEPADRYSDKGTGAELARHLLDQLGMQDVGLEATERGDHYDPISRTVRLSQPHFNGSSLAAVTVATHEVGHAIQHAREEKLFALRGQLVGLSAIGQKMGGFALIAAPVIALLTRTPQAGVLLLAIAVGSMALSTVVHLVTLPVELDASFNKALPLLQQGSYLHDGDLPHARKILRAAAFTYVAGSLSSLLNLGRWLTVLRR